MGDRRRRAKRAHERKERQKPEYNERGLLRMVCFRLGCWFVGGVLGRPGFFSLGVGFLGMDNHGTRGFRLRNISGDRVCGVLSG